MPKPSEAKLIAEMVDKRIEARVSGLEATVTKIYQLFKKLKETSSQKRLSEIEKEFHSIKSILREIDPKGLESDVFRRIGESQRKISSSIEENRRSIERLRQEFSARSAPSQPVQSDDSIVRGLESLKTKTKWLELEMEKINLPLILEKLKEIENRLDSIRISQPMIIE